MFTDAVSYEETKSTSLLADVTDDSCTLQYIEIVPLTRDTGSPSKTDFVKEENLAVAKQEPQDDDVINASCCTTNDAEHDEVDETQSHEQPVDVLEELFRTCVKKENNMELNTGSCSNDGSLTAHRKMHTGEQLYSCSQCGKCFSAQSALCHHMNIHADKYKCTECGRCCQSCQALATHKRSHSGEKPFECSVCSKRFTTVGYLVTHSRIHGEKPYKCHMCDKVFSRLGHLNSHMRVHTGDKPYKCSLCDKAFIQSGHLNNHMRVHTGDKPYKCHMCGKAFSQSGNLVNHMAVHTGGDKPYNCSLCDKAFSHTAHLNKHMRIHSGDKLPV